MIPATVSPTITETPKTETSKTETSNKLLVRPANGSYIIPPQGTKGRGKLTVVNPGLYDITVKLVEIQSMKTHRFFYVYAQDKATIQKIGAEEYYMFISEGNAWDADTQKFLLNSSFTKIAQSFDFRIKPIKIVTLAAVEGGNLNSIPIDEDDFMNK
jgi:hypothetical protein